MTPEQQPPTGCDAFTASIDRLIDGELVGEAQTALEAHLAGCDRCAETVQRLLEASRLLSELPELKCPDRVMQAVDAELLAEPHRTEPSRQLGKTIRYAAIALATAAALALLVAPPEPEPAPTPTEAEQIADARAALGELRSVLADNNSASAALKLRRGLVEPLEKTVSAVGDTKLGEWSATASAMLNAVSAAPSSKSG